MNRVIQSIFVLAVFLLSAPDRALAAEGAKIEPRPFPTAQPTGVTFAEPGTVPKTNKTDKADNSTPTRSSFNLFDQTVRKPYEFFKPENSLDGTLGPPVRPIPPPVRHRRAEAGKDQKNSWIFSTPEEILGIPTTTEILDAPEVGPNGEIKESKSAFERYLERTMAKDRATNAVNNTAADALPGWVKPEEKPGNETAFGKDAKSPSDSTPFSLMFRNQDTESSSPSNSDLISPFTGGVMPVPSSSTETFFSTANDPNSNVAAQPSAQDLAREARMEAFKQLLGINPAPTPSWGLNGTSPLGSPATLTPSSTSMPGLVGAFGASPPAPAVSSPSPSVSPLAPPASPFTPSLVPVSPAPVSRSVPPISAFELPKRKY